MKYKLIKKVAFGLAATAVITMTSGCQNGEPDVPKTAILETGEFQNVYEDEVTFDASGQTVTYKGQVYAIAHDPSTEYVTNEYTPISYENGLNTNQLFFVRIDGKIHLATRLIDKNESNIISKYYALDTGDFLGQTLAVNWYARATKNIEQVVPKGAKPDVYTASVSSSLLDKNYFDGEYGYGKNIMPEAVIRVSSVISDSKLSKEQINLLLTDTLLTTSYVESYLYDGLISIPKESFSFIPLKYTDGLGIVTWGFFAGFRGETSYYLNQMQEIVIETEESPKTLIGYFGSNEKEDSGYHYVYDISSGSFVDVPIRSIISTKDIVSKKTVGEIRNQFQPSLTETYPIESLKVISTKNLEGDDVFEDYYIVMREKYVSGDTYKYQVLGEEENVSVAGAFDGAHLGIAKNGLFKLTVQGEYDGRMMPLQECLTKNGLSHYEKETYTEEELRLLLVKLREKELDLGDKKTLTEARTKINAENIVVVDTAKEEGDSVLIGSDQRYYILIPYEMSEDIMKEHPSRRYYEVYDHSALCGLSEEEGYVRIDSLIRDYYFVYKMGEKLECVSTFHEVLEENGLEDSIRDGYYPADLQILANKLNNKEKVYSIEQK